MMTWPQIRSDNFFVSKLAKSTSGGRCAGLPVSTRIYNWTFGTLLTDLKVNIIIIISYNADTQGLAG